jgi:hypothetical protein
MKMRNYLIVKIGEVILVITVLLLCLAFKTLAQVQPSKISSNGMVLQREIAIPVWVKLEIYSAEGEKMETLLNETKPSGLNSVCFDTSQLREGIYFARIEFNSLSETQKIVLIR